MLASAACTGLQFDSMRASLIDGWHFSGAWQRLTLMHFTANWTKLAWQIAHAPVGWPNAIIYICSLRHTSDTGC